MNGVPVLVTSGEKNRVVGRGGGTRVLMREEITDALGVALSVVVARVFEGAVDEFGMLPGAIHELVFAASVGALG